MDRRRTVAWAHTLAALFMVLWVVSEPAAAGAQIPGLAAETNDSTPAVEVDGPSDAALQRRLRAILREIPGAEDIRVEVRSGVVHLEGSSTSLSATEKAVSVAKRLEGVVLVDNEVEQLRDLGTRLRPAGRKIADWIREAVEFLPVLLVAVAVFGVFLGLAALVRRWRHPLRVFGISPLTSRMVRLVVQAALVLVGLLLALDILDVMAVVGAVVGTLGLIGLVAGLAFKDIVSNYLPGLLLGLKPPFEAEDRVLLGDMEGHIVRVTPRETVLLTLDGEQMRIPNSKVFQETIVNFSRHRERRLTVDLELALEADLRRARDVGAAALAEVKSVLPEPAPFMRVRELMADRLRVRYFAWADQDAANFRNTESRARRALKEALLSAGLPFPTDTLVVGRSREAVAPSGAAPEGAPDDDTREAASEAFMEARLAEELAEPGERDLLREGREPPDGPEGRGRAPRKGASDA